VAILVNTRSRGEVVPSVVGLSVDEAVHAIKAAGLEVELERVLAFEGTRGVVVQQDPRPDTIAPSAATVALVLSE
jgi:beta-lactam-binding protein with PASTA domain